MSDLKEIEFNRDALVDKTNTLLDEVERLRQEWERSRERLYGVAAPAADTGEWLHTVSRAGCSLYGRMCESSS